MRTRRSMKRQRDNLLRSNIDRLSALPDSIITTHILSRLSWPYESAMTAVLSKRWQHLWTQSPKLSFIQLGDLSVPDFVGRVNRTLLFCGPDHCLEEFLVEFDYTKPFAPDVNAWIHFAVSYKVKRLTLLLLTDTTSPSDSHVLPMSLCSNPSLVSLDVRGCTVAAHTTIDWPSLTFLHIADVEVQQQILAKILAGCPVLSDLTLDECWGFTSLETNSEALVHIIIVDPDDHEGINDRPSLLEISAPCLESLSVDLSCPERRRLCLANIPSRVTATIDFIDYDVEISAEVMDNAKELLRDLHRVKEVKLGPNFVEVLFRVAIKDGYDHFPRSASRTSLTLNSNTDQIHGILGLLESSPNLEELVIQGQGDEMEPCNYNWASADGYQLSGLLQLKTVIFKNFVDPYSAPGEPLLTLIRILLKRTPVLGKIVICVKESLESQLPVDLRSILEILFRYPKSSKMHRLSSRCFNFF